MNESIVFIYPGFNKLLARRVSDHSFPHYALKQPKPVSPTHQALKNVFGKCSIFHLPPVPLTVLPHSQSLLLSHIWSAEQTEKKNSNILGTECQRLQYCLVYVKVIHTGYRWIHTHSHTHTQTALFIMDLFWNLLCDDDENNTNTTTNNDNSLYL